MARRYITPEYFRSIRLGVPLRQTTDDEINDYIEIATENVEQFTERIFEETEWTETFRGDDSISSFTHEYPVSEIESITEISIEDTPVSTELDPSLLVLTSSNTGAGRLELSGLDAVTIFSSANLYTVVYTAGFDPLPKAVMHATRLWATELMKPDFAGASDRVPQIIPMTSEQIADLLTPLRRRRI